jgi:hypothetical protein
MKQRTIRQRRSRRAQASGGTLVLVVVFLVALFAFAGLSIDVGNVYMQRARIQEAGDSEAMASVVDWAKGSASGVVAQRARTFASANGVLTNEVKLVRVGIWDQANRTFTEAGTFTSSQVPAVEVTNQRVVPMHFARVVGMPSMSPRTVSVAAVAAATGAAGVLPWATCDSLVPSRCTTVTIQIKDSGEENACLGGGPFSGNFGQISLGGSGASIYKDNIVNGYGGILRVGDCVYTDPGVSWGPTKSGIDDRLKNQTPYVCTGTSPPPVQDADPKNDKRQGYVPKVTTLDVSGKKQTCITGFYTVSLDGYNNSSKAVTVTFIEAFGGTEIDPSKPPVPGELSGVTLVK